MRALLIGLFFLCSLVGGAVADTLTGTVVLVSDGDTVKIKCADGACQKIRLYGIDAPEMKQEGGKRAREYLRGMLESQKVVVEYREVDRYRRIVGKIYLGERYVNRAMVVAGMAWHYERYARKDEDLRISQWVARQLKFGIWKQRSPVAPWEFRQQQRKQNRKTVRGGKDRKKEAGIRSEKHS